MKIWYGGEEEFIATMKTADLDQQFHGCKAVALMAWHDLDPNCMNIIHFLVESIM